MISPDENSNQKMSVCCDQDVGGTVTTPDGSPGWEAAMHDDGRDDGEQDADATVL